MRGVKKVDSHHSALYCALLKDSGELIYGLGDFDIHAQVTSGYVSTNYGKTRLLFDRFYESVTRIHNGEATVL